MVRVSSAFSPAAYGTSGVFRKPAECPLGSLTPLLVPVIVNLEVLISRSIATEPRRSGRVDEPYPTSKTNGAYEATKLVSPKIEQGR